MLCWFCYWGWPKVIDDIYQQALSKLDGDEKPLCFGPAHVVWEDENFDSAEWCLENFDKYSQGHSEQELAVVKWSLEELAKVPMSTRTVAREYNDAVDADQDVHPKDYPPPKGMEMATD
jgi:hypothetical protein